MTQADRHPSADDSPDKDQVLDSLHGWSPRDLNGAEPPTAEGQVGELRQENAQLREAIDNRAVIEQAKGALMLRYGLDDEAAFAVLRRWSQNSNTKLNSIADTLVNSVCRDDPQPPDDPTLAEWLQEQIRTLPPRDAGRSA